MGWAVTAEPERFDEAVEWFGRRFPITEELAEALGDYAGDRAWTIAGVAQLDVVLFTFESLERAIARGTDFATWQSEVEEQLTKAWGRRDSFRLETIFRNATQQALNAGRWRQMNEPSVKALRPYVLFDGIEDDRQTPICNDCDGTIVHIDDPWLDTHSPQLHHRCRSSLRTLRESEARRRGISESPPDVAASKGFGRKPTEARFEPERAKYPAELWDEYQRKRDQIAKRAKRRKPKPTKKKAS